MQVQELVANVKGASKALPALASGLQASAKSATESMAALIDASANLDRGNAAVPTPLALCSLSSLLSPCSHHALAGD